MRGLGADGAAMVKRNLYLVQLDEALDAQPLPDCAFRIGEGDSAGICQFPNLRALVFRTIGKAPMPTPAAPSDEVGMGLHALGRLVADAYLKLSRPWQRSATDWLGCFESAAPLELEAIADGLLPLSPSVEAVRSAYLSRIDEFIGIALHMPNHLPGIVARIDLLTNERLTERARAILETGIDPGEADLWPCKSSDWAQS